MIQLFLTRDLAFHVASHLPEADPLRTGLAESIAREDLLGGCIDEPAALTILRRGKIEMEVFSEEDAERIRAVIACPKALQTIALEGGRRARIDAAAETVDTLVETLGLRA